MTARPLATPADLLSELGRLGVELWLDRNVLRYRAPTGVLTEAMRKQMSLWKAELSDIIDVGDGPTESWPLTDRQLRLWLLELRQGATPEYNMHAAFRLHGQVDFSALHDAIRAVVKRHPILESVVNIDSNGLPVLVGGQARDIVDELNLDGSSDGLIYDVAAELSSRPMDLTHGPLTRIAILRVSNVDLVLVIVIHHVISDDYSIRIVCNDILECYQSLRNDNQLPVAWAATRPAKRRLAETARSAKPDYERIAQRRGELLPKSRPALPKPVDPVGIGPWASSTALTALDPSERSAWEAGRRAAGATTSVLTIVLTALAIAASGGPECLLIGTPFHGRSSAEDSTAVGYYVQPLIVLVDVDRSLTFGELTDATTADFRSALAVCDFSYETYTGSDIHSIAGGHVVWVVTYGAETVCAPEGLTVQPLQSSVDIARHDLRVALADHTTKTEVSVTHRRSTVDGAFANRTAQTLDRLFRDVPARTDSVDDILRLLEGLATKGSSPRVLRTSRQ